VTGEAGPPPEFGVLPPGFVEREPDGLARSPGNATLTPEERRAAPGLFLALLAGHLLHELGEKSPAKILKAVRMALETEPLISIDALALIDEKTFLPVKKVDRRVVLAASVRIGSARLTDSVRFG